MSRDYQRQMKIENFVKANTDKFHEIYDTMKEEQICYDKKWQRFDTAWYYEREKKFAQEKMIELYTEEISID